MSGARPTSGAKATDCYCWEHRSNYGSWIFVQPTSRFSNAKQHQEIRPQHQLTENRFGIFQNINDEEAIPIDGEPLIRKTTITNSPMVTMNRDKNNLVDYGNLIGRSNQLTLVTPVGKGK